MPVPPFVARLRSRIGHELLWLPGVTAVLFDEHDRVLLGKRADNHLWALVSGILEPGEEPAIGLRREIAEETGVQAEVLHLTSVTAGDEVSYPNGDRSQYLDLTFLCRHVSGEPRVADDESLDVGWFALDELPEDLADTSRQRLEHTLRFQADPAAGPVFVR